MLFIFKTQHYVYNMSRPALIPHALKSNFHNKNCCIDVREGCVHAIKANTNNRSWHNEVTKTRAAIAINRRTPRENKLVFESKTPIHVVSFGCGANTYYWGRYKFVKKKRCDGQLCFELKFVDNGDLDKCLPKDAQETRSLLERNWLDAMEISGTEHAFEPATLHLPSSTLLPDKEYTPDIWLTDSSEFVEIKGPPPSKKEFEKCRLASQLGFKIKMFHGGPDGFNCYTWSSEGKRTVERHNSWYRYLHPREKRKRRKIHNVSS